MTVFILFFKKKQNQPMRLANHPKIVCSVLVSNLTSLLACSWEQPSCYCDYWLISFSVFLPLSYSWPDNNNKQNSYEKLWVWLLSTYHHASSNKKRNPTKLKTSLLCVCVCDGSDSDRSQLAPLYVRYSPHPFLSLIVSDFSLIQHTHTHMFGYREITRC